MRQKGPVKAFVGPTVTSKGDVIGDAMAIESAVFESKATPEQISFRDELLEINEVAAIEYMLTISGAIDVWREDMVILQKLLDYLEQQEDFLDREENLLEKGMSIKKKSSKESIKLHKSFATLNKHFPDLFDILNAGALSLESLIQQLKDVEKKVRSEENYIKAYLDKKKKDMPFLFN